MIQLRQLYLLLFSLYWAQGLPVGFMTHALPVILRAQGVSLAHIGGFGLLMLPWSIKVFWAPWIDRHGSRSKGHYRSWIIPMQLLSVWVLVFLSFLPIQSLNEPMYLLLFFVALLSMNLVGATQDVATDGLAVNILKTDQQHWGNSFQVIGSRLGFIVGGGAVLWALDWLDWQATFLFLAALVFINTIPIFLYREPLKPQLNIISSQENDNNHKHTSGLFYAIRQYLAYFTQTKTLTLWLMILLSFKLADGLAGPLFKPLMVDLGLSFSQIGLYVTMLGAVAALIGAGLAGLSLKYISRAQALVFYSVLKIFSLLAYAWLALQFEAKRPVHEWLIYGINAAEDMISAMLLVIMLTLVMQYSRKAFAATDFTFQVAIMATVSGGLYSISGIVADQLGYSTYLFWITGLAALSLVPILFWGKASKNDQNHF